MRYDAQLEVKNLEKDLRKEIFDKIDKDLTQRLDKFSHKATDRMDKMQDQLSRVDETAKSLTSDLEEIINPKIEKI